MSGIFGGTPRRRALGETAPGAYWPDARVKEMQTLLNAELKKFGCSSQLKVDGLVGAGTCGALLFASNAQKATQQPWGLTDFWAANGPAMIGGCQPFLPGTAPACPPPVPSPPPAVAPAPTPTTAPAPDGRALMVQLQGLLNQALIRYGYQPIAVTGQWDAATCGAGAAVNPLLPLGDALRQQIGSLTAQVIATLGKPCGSTIAGVAPQKQAAAPAPAPPAPAPRPAPSQPAVSRTGLPPLNRDGECVIDYGSRYAEIGDLQRQMNVALVENKLKPIPVTGVWDAATCGAMFALQGKFTPKPSKACPHFYSVPLNCPSVQSPKSTTPLWAWGLAALAGAGALVYYKSKAGGA